MSRERVLGLSGVGDERSFKIGASKYCDNLIDCVNLQDHYDYYKNAKQLKKLLRKYSSGGRGLVLLTTAKDAIKITALDSSFLLWIIQEKIKIYIVDVEMELLDDLAVVLIQKIKSLIFPLKR